MAIEKAKRYGVGFVVAQNSTHYGIAGYYATMASEQGCVGLTGTNARPSIAPTFGVEPMMVSCYGNHFFVHSHSQSLLAVEIVDDDLHFS